MTTSPTVYSSQVLEPKVDVLEDDDDRSYDGSLDGYDSDGSDFTLQELEQPILVGYAFGPKKMQTMEFVMAEASKTQLSAAVMMDRRTPSKTEHSCSKTLTSAMLSSRQPKSETVILTMSGGPSGSGLRNIVRHFRSSCSSIGLDDGTSTSASGTVTTCLTSTGLSMASAPSHAAQHPLRVSFVPLDLDAPLEEQHGGHFDVILHKMTEDILCLSTAEALSERPSTTTVEAETDDDALSQARERIHRLNQYQLNYPQCSLVDHPSHVQVVMSRWEISLLLEASLVGVTSASGWPVSTPKFYKYDGKEENGSCELTYPLIAKPLTAAGTKKSHCMGIVLNEGGLEAAVDEVGDDTSSCLLQEYVNHNANLFKVYVLGEHMHVFRRPSLPNLPTGTSTLNNMKESYKEFDSQQRPYPTARDFGLDLAPKCTTAPPNHEVVKDLTREEIAPVVNVLRQAFGLELFGFDILLSDDGRNELLVVDVNYFPSYKEVSNFPSLLAKYLTQRAIQARKTGIATEGRTVHR